MTCYDMVAIRSALDLPNAEAEDAISVASPLADNVIQVHLRDEVPL